MTSKGTDFSDDTGMMKELASLEVQIGKVRIPRVLLGTSPFVGAGQFGARASLYYTKFYRNPRNIVEIIRKAAELGVLGLQVLPVPPVLDAVREAETKLGKEFTIVGSVGLDDPVNEITRLQSFNTPAMIIHAQITDAKNIPNISRLLDQIHNASALAGLATHKPLSILNWLDGKDFDYDLLMIPFNKLGAFMDGTPDEIANAAKKLRKPIVAKKVLAAGKLDLEEALTYVSAMEFIDVFALGVASESEAEDTFRAALKALCREA